MCVGGAAYIHLILLNFVDERIRIQTALFGSVLPLLHDGALVTKLPPVCRMTSPVAYAWCESAASLFLFHCSSQSISSQTTHTATGSFTSADLQRSAWCVRACVCVFSYTVNTSTERKAKREGGALI